MENTVIVFSNVLIPDFTARAVGFVPEDLEVAAGLDNLAPVAKRRMEAEKEVGKPHKETRTDREATRTARRDLKVAQRQEVKRLYNDGMKPDEISERSGVSRRTVFNWIEEADF